MDIQFFCPRWESEQLSWDLFGHKASNAGYNGFKMGIASTATEADFPKHYDLYCAWLKAKFLFSRWSKTVR